MTRTASTSPTPDTPTHWACDVAGHILSLDADTQRTRDDATDRAARLHDRAQDLGAVWFQRFVAELDAAALAFNRRAGRPVVELSRSLTGLVTVSARTIDGAGWLMVTPILPADAQDRRTPGAIVRERRHGLEAQRGCDFVLVADDLCIDHDGAALTPEAFGRALLAPWLAAIPLGR